MILKSEGRIFDFFYPGEGMVEFRYLQGKLESPTLRNKERKKLFQVVLQFLKCARNYTGINLNLAFEFEG